MPTYLFIISKKIYNNILNGRLKKVVTDRKTDDFQKDGYIIELRSQKNNRIRYYTTENAIKQAKINLKLNINFHGIEFIDHNLRADY